MTEQLGPEATPPYDSTVILDGSNPLFSVLPPEQQNVFQTFENERQVMAREISEMAEAGKLPGAHGTTSDNLESILAHGLGAVMPVGALARSKSTTDAASPEGMLGAYLFAKGLKGNMLAIQREQVDPEGDVLTRYTKLSPAISEPSLRRQIERYFQMRAGIVGPAYEEAYPVLFVVSSTDPNQVRANNPAVPSERRFEGIFEKENFAMICVPESKKAETQILIDKYNIQLKARALEPLELF